jgi:hypothetical protein
MPTPTLDQPRTVLREVLDDYVPPPVSQEAIERRRIFVQGYGVADFDDTAISTIQ